MMIDKTGQKINIAVIVKLSLCYEDIWGSGGIALPFLISTLNGSELSASGHRSFTPREWVPGIGGWMGPRFCLNSVEKTKILHCRKSNLGRSVRSPSEKINSDKYS
jgi:hypothetical protein